MVLEPGEYGMAGHDGQEIDLPHAITVSVTADTIAVTSDCVTPRWTYRVEQGRMITAPVATPICKRGLLPEEAAFYAVFAAPDAVARTPANGLDVRGGGHVITLYTQ